MAPQFFLRHGGRVTIIKPDHALRFRPQISRRKNGAQFLEGFADLQIGSTMFKRGQLPFRFGFYFNGKHGIFSSVRFQQGRAQLTTIAERTRGHAIARPENPGEALNIVMATFLGHVPDRPIALHQPAGGTMQSDPPNCFGTGLPGHRAKHAMPVKPAHRRDIGQRIKGQVPSRIVMDIIQDPEQTFLVAICHLGHPLCVPETDMTWVQFTNLAELHPGGTKAI